MPLLMIMLYVSSMMLPPCRHCRRFDARFFAAEFRHADDAITLPLIFFFSLRLPPRRLRFDAFLFFTPPVFSHFFNIDTIRFSSPPV